MTIMQNALHTFTGDWSWVPPKAASIGPREILAAPRPKLLAGRLSGSASPGSASSPASSRTGRSTSWCPDRSCRTPTAGITSWAAWPTICGSTSRRTLARVVFVFVFVFGSPDANAAPPRIRTRKRIRTRRQPLTLVPMRHILCIAQCIGHSDGTQSRNPRQPPTRAAARLPRTRSARRAADRAVPATPCARRSASTACRSTRARSIPCSGASKARACSRASGARKTSATSASIAFRRTAKPRSTQLHGEWDGIDRSLRAILKEQVHGPHRTLSASR